MKIFKVGLTGGIGAGKTTVANMLHQMGAVVYNCDTRAKELMTTKLKEPLVALLGEGAYDGSGNLNRAYISSLIFNDPQILKSVNCIVHPAVEEDFNSFVEQLEQNTVTSPTYVVKEAAILFESGADIGLDMIVVVSAPIELRIARVVSRDGVPTEKVQERIASQMSQEKLLQYADYIISTDATDKSLLLQKVQQLHSAILTHIAQS